MRRPGFKQLFIPSTADSISLARILTQVVQAIKESLDTWLQAPRALTNVIETRLIYAVDGGGNPIPNVINHKLPLATGTTPEGWCVTDIDGGAIVYRTAWDDKTISLVPGSATVNVKLEVW